MTTTNKVPTEEAEFASDQRASTVSTRTIGIGLGVAVSLFGYALLSGDGLSTYFSTTGPAPVLPHVAALDPSSTHSKTELHLTRDTIDLLLETLDQAIRRKDVDGVLQHIAPDAVITIHMTQGTQQQIATLTREEYRKTLAMGFAFPSANDFARVSTTVSVAPDERSAKVSYKSTETIRQANRELKIEGEETLIVGIRDDKPVITSLDKIVPGDST
jgi:hypothetical protein